MWVTVALESHTYGVVSIVTRVRHTCTQYAGTQLFSVFICVHHNCGQFGKRWPSFSTFHFLSITLSWTFTRVAKFRPSSSSLQFPVNRYYLQVHLCACCNSNIYIYMRVCIPFHENGFPLTRRDPASFERNRTRLDFDRWKLEYELSRPLFSPQWM